MLSAKELFSLTLLLTPTNKPLEVIGANFRRSLPKADQFTTAVTLYMMIEDNLLVSPEQKIIAYYILSDLYSSTNTPISSTPFLRSFLDILTNEEKFDTWEKNMVAFLLEGSPAGVRY
jgi:hypothetical protein